MSEKTVYSLMKSYSNKRIELINLYSRIILPAIFVTLFSLSSSYAKAGIFSSVNASLISEVDAVTAPKESAQNMQILEAALNPDPNILYKESDVVMVANSALDSEQGPAGTSADVSGEKNNGQISVYTVKKGDTLSEISDLFDISVNTILWTNNLSKNASLKDGQTLIILPISGIKYTIKSGDTLKSIITKYKADMNEVLSYNDLNINSKLDIGDEVIIPDVDMADSIPVSTPSTSKIASNGNSKYLGGSGPSYPGYYIRPVVGGRKTQGIHGWNAVDIGVSVGTPIYASADGTVMISADNGGWNKGYGNYVVIMHPNGTQTVYGHASKTLVRVGQIVKQGDMIALSGNTGKSTGPHVHFEIRGAKNPF
ncbi:MAG: M23 family metallopeptidase [bacterium]